MPKIDLSNNFDDGQNIIIEGDNLEVLKIIRNSYFNSIDVIYIDPPYNTGNDFVYNDEFKQSVNDYKIENELINSEGIKTSTNQKTDGRFHTNWLNMIYPRLIIAKQLLKKEGIIFISIDDNEQARLKLICDEIFGEENFLSCLIWHARRGGGNDAKNIAIDHEYILCYAKSKEKCLFIGKEKLDDDFEYIDNHYEIRGKYNLQQFDRASLTYTKSLDYGIEAPDGTIIYPGHVNEEEWIKRKNNSSLRNDWRWMMSYETYLEALKNDFIVFQKNKMGWNVKVKTYQRAEYKNPDKVISRYLKLRSILNNDFGITKTGNIDLANLELKNNFSYAKPINIVKNILKYYKNKNCLVLDFFAGSGTTGHAVMNLNKEDGGNRKYILVQLNEQIKNNNNYQSIIQITKDRIDRAINKYQYNDGYKYFKCQSSNIIQNTNDNPQISLNFDEFNNYIKPNRSSLDLVYEILLKIGIKLDVNILKLKNQNEEYYEIENNNILLFFDSNNSKPYNIVEINKIISDKYENNPNNLQIWFIDAKFDSDENKLNCIQQINNLSENIKIVVI